MTDWRAVIDRGIHAHNWVVRFGQEPFVDEEYIKDLYATVFAKRYKTASNYIATDHLVDRGGSMRRYVLVSGIFFALFTCVQLLRLLLRWPVQVASVDIPLWFSGVAVIIVGSLTIWAFRTAARSDVNAGI